MANQEQVALLKQGVKAWNSWRSLNLHIGINLSSINFRERDLKGINFCGTSFRLTNLSKSDFSDAILSNSDLSWTMLMAAILEFTDLRNTVLVEADLGEANLFGSNLTKAKLRKAVLIEAEIIEANLSGADLTEAKLSEARLWNSNMIEANCHSTNFYRTDISGADFSRANLSHANLTLSTAVRTNFTSVDFTGACIENWNINSETVFDDVACEYIYLKNDYQERRPNNGNFAPGEFAALIKEFFQSIDLIFVEGIDWQAFFQSFQDLRDQYGKEVSVQGIERKGTDFIIRLETNANADKASIETCAKALYNRRLKQLETQYKQGLLSQGAHLEDIRYTLDEERRRSTQLLNILEVMAQNQPNNQTNIYGNVGVQHFGSGNIRNFTQNIGNNRDEIENLIKSLRKSAQFFPEEQAEAIEGELEDLEHDIKTTENHQPKRIGRRLKRLIAAGATVAAVGGSAMTEAVDLSAKANEFTGNVKELADKLGIELVQPD